jgi:hypothetical protein
MITVSEAFSILQNNLPTLKEENCSLLEARKKDTFTVHPFSNLHATFSTIGYGWLCGWYTR